MVRATKRVGLHFGNWLVEVVDLLHGITDLLWIGADLIERIQQKPHAVVGLCGSNRVKVAALILKHALYLFVQRPGICTMFGRIGSHRHHTFDHLLASELEEVRRNQCPRSGPRRLQANLLHTFGDLHGSWRQRISNDEIYFCILHLGELRRHV